MTYAERSHEGQALAARAFQARLAAHQDGWARTLAQWQGASPCQHCWHRRDPRVSGVPGPRQCCWCGVHEDPQHGPYAEDGRG